MTTPSGDESTVIELTTQPLDISAILQSMMRDNTTAGALSTFIGTTRGWFEGKRVLHLSYQSYEPLAKKTLLALTVKCRQMFLGTNETAHRNNNDNHRLLRIAIYHRLGQVPVGEASVLIAVTSVHRRSAMRAVEYLIDWLKAEAAIWKQEVYEDGTGEWKENCCN
jgi:molybdopterin synthase catalytic subunit